MIEFTTGLAFVLSSVYVGVSNSNIEAKIVRPIENNIIVSTSSVDIITSKEVEKYLREAFKDEPILIDIARCESHYRQFDREGHILRGKANDADVGVMQINEKYHAEKAVELGINIYTLEGNVEFAKYLYDTFGARPWKASSKCWGSEILAQS